jgi:hypothetical protein
MKLLRPSRRVAVGFSASMLGQAHFEIVWSAGGKGEAVNGVVGVTFLTSCRAQ